MKPDGPTLGAVVTARMAAAGRGLRPRSRAWAEAMDGLAESLLGEAVSEHTDGVPGGSGGLDAAVLVRRRAVGSLDAELRASAGVDLRHNLGVDLTNRYRLGGGLSDLQDACELAREVLADASLADRLIAAATLAGRLGLLARVPGHETELGRAIRVLTDTLERSADDDPARPIAATSLAGLQTQRWQRVGDLAALDAAAAALQAELRRGHITGTTPTAVNAAGLLLDYGEQTHDLALFQQAEDLLRAIAEHGSPEEVIAARGTLAIALVTRFDLTGGEDLLTEAITLASDAITARRPGPERAEDLSTRAAARAALGRQRGDRALLDAAIGDARAAAAEPATHPADASGPANCASTLPTACCPGSSATSPTGTGPYAAAPSPACAAPRAWPMRPSGKPRRKACASRHGMTRRDASAPRSPTLWARPAMPGVPRSTRGEQPTRPRKGPPTARTT